MAGDSTDTTVGGTKEVRVGPCSPFLTALRLMSVICHNGIVGHSRGVASLCGWGGGGMYGRCGLWYLCGRRPASAFLSGADEYVDFAGEVAVDVVSPTVLAGDVAVGVASPAIAGATSLADLTGGVAVGKASPAVAGGVTVGVLMLGWLPWPMLGWRPWPMLGRRPWPMLGWCPWPMLGWRPWPMLGWRLWPILLAALPAE